MSLPTTLRVAVAQMRFAPDIPSNLAMMEEMLLGAVRRHADVVLFPECCTTGYAYDFRQLDRREIGNTLLWLGRIAEAHRIHLLVGTPVYAGRKLYNCLVYFDRQGRIQHVYAKCQLTPRDAEAFTPGDAVSLFNLGGLPATSIICHERRYPELVRLAVMAGARIIFHPNAGMDALAVSRNKRKGRDGIAVRAFESAAYYVFANSVGPQGGGKWSAGDSKIVAPDGRVLALAGNTREELIVADLDLAQATGKYAQESLRHPRFLRPHWRTMLKAVRQQSERWRTRFDLP